ncbi:hypothetical protein JAO76_08920 [Pontibacter sp. BT310]|uniref:DUF4149 domain-containing protein n=1 Tax=Pontibacter populi TaxID=890055 RepID=A0ABS6XB24_9BACT|nr:MULTISPECIES: hypothetical protein [Pontibacter]MBJ6118311.1 hypothetical protein [Pontibacter sp. BT310]MBR0570738.1 hypothetical protein [Microvirga sp. STS03]MBW3365164.1 hypothetical protein [Pontibacter populi]
MAPEHYLILLTFLWVGFVSAISFMEAWLKFRAPGVTLAIGLSIGRLIFSGMNKVEWFFGLASLALLFVSGFFGDSMAFFLYIPILILLLQSIWLLPAMNKRAELVISGAELPKSVLHFYYIGAELVKVIMIVSFGVTLLGTL